MQTANLYNYDFNNPLLFIDIDGTSAFSLAIPIIKWGGKKAAIAMIPGFGQAATLIGLGWTIYEGAKLGYEIYKNHSKSDDKYKKPKSGISGKEKSNNAPSWAKGNRPYKGESGKDFAKRLLDEKYGKKNHDMGPTSEFNQLKKYGDRAFE